MPFSNTNTAIMAATLVWKREQLIVYLRHHREHWGGALGIVWLNWPGLLNRLQVVLNIGRKISYPTPPLPPCCSISLLSFRFSLLLNSGLNPAVTVNLPGFMNASCCNSLFIESFFSWEMIICQYQSGYPFVVEVVICLCLILNLQSYHLPR